MSIFIWIMFGGLVGFVASLIMGSNGGFLRNVIVGIVGAVIGGFIMSLLGKGLGGNYNIYSFLVALLGACVLIVITRAVVGHR